MSCGLNRCLLASNKLCRLTIKLGERGRPTFENYKAPVRQFLEHFKGGRGSKSPKKGNGWFVGFSFDAWPCHWIKTAEQAPSIFARFVFLEKLPADHVGWHRQEAANMAVQIRSS